MHNLIGFMCTDGNALLDYNYAPITAMLMYEFNLLPKEYCTNDAHLRLCRQHYGIFCRNNFTISGISHQVLLLGERERAHLVVQLGRAVCMYIYIYIYVFMYLCIYPVSVYRVPDTVNF